ncbi:MAG: hypothetical protein EON88_03155 [Brevundimonas sp.]|nr:MAG: hypothetical protein EON88_03155 [Brevundimonas sp.]
MERLVRGRGRLASIVAVGTLVGAVALCWWIRTSEFVARDACLDAGGRWIHGACEGARMVE